MPPPLEPLLCEEKPLLLGALLLEKLLPLLLLREGEKVRLGVEYLLLVLPLLICELLPGYERLPTVERVLLSRLPPKRPLLP